MHVCILVCRLNYFRVCRIILDHIPQVLRGMFYNRQRSRGPWRDSSVDGKWFMGNEQWDSRLSQVMRTKIEQGDSKSWDSTILFHVLLYSSHCLFANKVPGTQGSLQTDSKMVKATTKSVDLRNYISNGYTVLCDLGSDFFRAQVTGRIQPNNFFVSKAFKDPSTDADIYVCTKEWQVLEELSRMRNKKFAHVTSCSATNRELHFLVQDLQRIYKQLNVPEFMIAEMKSMATGKYVATVFNVNIHSPGEYKNLLLNGSK